MPPLRYRKRPVEIEAMQHDGTTESMQAIHKWMRHDYARAQCNIIDGRLYFSISTLEGIMTVSPDDYVIKGIAGEFYPCKPGIFQATYEWIPS